MFGAAMILPTFAISRSPDSPRPRPKLSAMRKCRGGSQGHRENTKSSARRSNTGRRGRGGASFLTEAAELITTIVERDLPFYDPVIYEEAVAGLNRFAQSIGHLTGPAPYEQVVAVRFRDLSGDLEAYCLGK